jgi:hypothetical protein
MLRIELSSTSIIIYLILLMLLWLTSLLHLTFGLRLFLLLFVWLTFNLLQPFRMIFFFGVFMVPHMITLALSFFVVYAMCFFTPSTLNWPHPPRDPAIVVPFFLHGVGNEIRCTSDRYETEKTPTEPSHQQDAWPNVVNWWRSSSEMPHPLKSKVL